MPVPVSQSSVPLVTEGAGDLRGVVESVVYRNEETGYGVLTVTPSGAKKGQTVAVVGVMPPIGEGETLHVSGAWKDHSRFGKQFVLTTIRISPPTSAEGIERFLGSGMIPGIGRGFAKKLVETFGESLFDVIERMPDLLKKVEGVGPARIKALKEGWESLKAVREIMIFLYGHGVSTGNALRIYKEYGADAIEIVKGNPYRLSYDIYGIGFKTADAIAKNMGMAPDDPNRIDAGINYVMKKNLDDGNTGIQRESLLEKSVALLELPSDKVSDRIGRVIVNGDLIVDSFGENEDVIFLPVAYHTERAIAEKLTEMMQGGTPPGWSVSSAGDVIDSFNLSEEQRRAVVLSLSNRVSYLTGGPGTGKTTTTKALLSALEKSGAHPVLCAPTGRAAKRMAETTGREAKTIHRLTGYGRPDTPKDLKILGNPIIVDEMSMVDIFLMKRLLDCTKEGTSLIMIGDVDQLPSVGPGEVLRSVIDSGKIPGTRLTKIFRQAAGSAIIENAHRINRREMVQIAKKGERTSFRFLALDSPEKTPSEIAIRSAEMIVKIVKESLPSLGFDPVRDVQVLSPMRKGDVGVEKLNPLLQNALNPKTEYIETFGTRYAMDDKVMQLRNNYEKDVYNGDVGYIVGLNREMKSLSVDFDGNVVVYEYRDLDEIALAYASTIHKSQGSEYPVVVIPAVSQHQIGLTPNLIYTGITRGKTLVVMVGQEKAVRDSLRMNRTTQRIVKLNDFLQDARGIAPSRKPSPRLVF